MTVNSVPYPFDSSTIDTFDIAVSGGTDDVTATGTSGSEVATVGDTVATLASANFTFSASAESVIFNSGGGVDSATFNDSTGDDLFDGNAFQAKMNYSNGSSVTAVDFDETYANATSGNDLAFLFDGSGNDLVTMTSILGSITFNMFLCDLFLHSI